MLAKEVLGMGLGPQGIQCARLGCGDTDTKPTEIAGSGGAAYILYLCKKHREEIERKGCL